jgi:phage/plasmid-like protein (TIGR03299 family)
MPDMLDITAGVATFISAQEEAWHRLGTTKFDRESLTAEEVLTEGHLGGWNLRKVPIFAQTEFGRIQVPGRAAVIRDNPIVKGQIDVVGDVGEDYAIIQNEQHTAFLNALVEESGAVFDTAGALDANGRRVFVTMKLPGNIKVGGVDRVDLKIAALNAHDSSMSFKLLVTPIRIVCGNTWNMAVHNHSAMFSVRHRANAVKNIAVEEARKALDLTFAYIDEVQTVSNQLADTTLTQARFEEIIAAEFGVDEDASKAAITRAEKKLDEMAALFADAATQEGIRGTAYAGLNALTEWFDHLSPVRGDDPDASRARKALLDTNGFKQKALDLMMAEAGIK